MNESNYEKALRNIDAAYLVDKPDLDLGGLGLSTLPVEIKKLTNVRKLNLRANQLKELPPEIGKLKNLEVLFLSNKSSKRSSNHISKLPTEFFHLAKLQYLDLSNNELAGLPPEISQLSGITDLLLAGNQLISLPPEIGQLTNLEELDLENNRLSKIPPEIIRLKKLKYLNLTKNELIVPEEILQKIYEPRIIFNFFSEVYVGFRSELVSLRQREYLEIHIVKAKPINQIKLLLVGQGSVGKTSLIHRILHNTFDSNQTKTEGISINQWKVANRSKIENQNSEIKVNIWDFGGQEIMHATHQFFLTKRSLYLLVLDSRLTQEENRVEYWLKIIQSFGGESPVLIVGNKTDQNPLDIDRTGLQKKYPNIVGILETSAATGAGIEALKAEIAKQVDALPHVRDLLPETWFTVKTKLEELGHQSNFITHDKYLELCVENKVDDETSQRTLIGFLHDLGVILYFQDDYRLSELGILSPQWVTNGVYKIINSPILFQNKGVLTLSILDEILNLPEYPRSKRLAIVDLMKRFELCYDLETDKTFLVPDLLPKDKPADLKLTGTPAFEYIIRSYVPA